MKGQNTLFTPIEFGIISEPKSYWATHFYSVLQCLHFQKNFSHLAFNLRFYPHWTLSNLRGTMPSNFFYQIRSHVQNHGFQYFLTTFLNQKMGSDVVSKLIRRLSEIYGVMFSNDYNQYAFYMAGWDSTLSTGLDQRFQEVFPLASDLEIAQILRRADLCLILTNPVNQLKVALFGEVEGNHGINQLRRSYWTGRPRLSSFSVGVSKNQGKQCFITNIKYSDVERVHIQFESAHYVVRDYDSVLSFFEHAFHSGPHSPYPSGDEEFAFFVNIIKINWDTPMEELLGMVFSYVNQHDLMETKRIHNPNLTDIQS